MSAVAATDDPLPVRRTRRFARFCDTITSTPNILAAEMLNARYAVDHEFASDADRDQYVAYLDALGRFQYATAFAANVAEWEPMYAQQAAAAAKS